MSKFTNCLHLVSKHSKAMEKLKKEFYYNAINGL